MNQNAKTKRPFPYVSVCLAVIAVLIAVVLVFSALESSGIMGKMDTAVKSDNYKVSANELAVYEYQVALSSLANQFWYYQYGLIQDTYGVTKLYSNAYEYAYAQLPLYMGTGAFASDAYSYAQQYVVYCEGATAAGVTMDAEDQTAVDNYMKDLEATAESLGITLKTFIKTYIGAGISVKEVRSAFEKSVLGAKYAEIKNEELSDAVTEDEMLKYKEENKGSFYKNFYHSYVLVNESLKADAEKCDTVDELKEVIIKYMVDTKFDDLYKSKITDAKLEDTNGKDKTEEMVLETLLAELGIKKPVAEDETTKGDDAAEAAEDDKTEDKEEDKKEETYTKHFTSADKEGYKKAGYEIVTAIKSAITTETGKISQDASTAYVDLSDEDAAKKATDLQKWLFGEGRKVGDVKVITTEKTSTDKDGKETKTTTNTWYVVTKVMFLDEEKTKDAYYLTFTDDKKDEKATGTEAETGSASTELKKGKDKAEEFYKALEEAMKKEDFDFDKLATELKFQAEGATALKENITEKGAVSALADWLYEEGRKEGDITKVNSGSTYYVAYFVEENDMTWKVNARAAVASEKQQAWFDEMVKKYNVTVDTEAVETETENHEGHDHD
ncbi:MAG: hypothetical protein IJW00_04345 [Clostridia bacterium]|nr:hypothetical protein [Clostridia bacterium]